MELNWTLHPKAINVQVAQSAAFQYRLQEWNDGQAELTVQHRGDRPSAKPVKHFVYKNRKAAFGGANRFENQHGYRDHADRIPAAVAPFLPPFSERTRQLILNMQQQAQGKTLVPYGIDVSMYVEMATEDYDALCNELLCCRIYDCYNRTEPSAQQCDVHRANNETTEN